MTDVQLAELLGMTPQNLRATYKKSTDPIKQRVYEIMKLGAEAWLSKKKQSKKNGELIDFVQKMEPLESFKEVDDPVEYVNTLRKGREFADIS